MTTYPKLLLAWGYLLLDNVPAQIRRSPEDGFDRMIKAVELQLGVEDVHPSPISHVENALGVLSDDQIDGLCAGDEEDQELALDMISAQGFDADVVEGVLDSMWRSLDFGVLRPSK